MPEVAPVITTRRLEKSSVQIAGASFWLRSIAAMFDHLYCLKYFSTSTSRKNEFLQVMRHSFFIKNNKKCGPASSRMGYHTKKYRQGFPGNYTKFLTRKSTERYGCREQRDHLCEETVTFVVFSLSRAKKFPRDGESVKNYLHPC